MEFKISQSLIKAYFDVKVAKKECGIFFQERYINRNPLTEMEPTAAMKEGIYFEYLCTGMLPRNGKVPEPERTAKGFLTENYKRIEEAAKFFKLIISFYKIKIIAVGVRMYNDDMDGILDIFAEWDGVKCIIDLKYSGLIDDRWSDMGWETESLPTKDTVMVQGVHYKILANDWYKIYNIPFFFFIFNSKDSLDMKIIKQNVDEDRFEKHRQLVQDVKRKIAFDIKDGFKPINDYRVCINCPLFDTCAVATKFPTVIEVDY